MKNIVNYLIYVYVVKDSNIYLIKKEFPNSDFSVLEKIQNNTILNIDNLNLKQCYTFIKKDNVINLNILYIDIISHDEKIKEKLINLQDDEYNKKGLEYIKNIFPSYNILKRIYPKYFTIPELQKLTEFIYKEKYDRRNFRKKLLKSGVVIDINEYGKTLGRPGKLYEFKSDTDIRVL